MNEQDSSNIPFKSKAELAAILETLEAAVHRKTYRRIDFFTPYIKQRQFLELGATCRERLLMAANRVGKTEIGAFEAACHLTGVYPRWWQGRRFTAPIKMWVCGETSQAVRDVCQQKLFGEPGVADRLGSGMVPKELIVETTRAHGGIMYALDGAQVKHVSGGTSIVSFKSYEQGREKFQGAGLNAIWFDEEPPLPIYAEGLTRIGELDGVAWMTFTPLKGPSGVVLRFTDEPSPDRAIVGMTIDDVPLGGHISPDAKAKIIAGYLPHEREARARGLPMLGSGRIFSTPEPMLTEAPLEQVPAYWTKLWGIDFGIGHPFAAVLGIWDNDNDVLHIHHCIRLSDAITLTQIAAMQKIGANVPVAWPADGTNRDPHSGEVIATTWRKMGAKMLPEHAQWAEGGVSTEAGIAMWDEMEKTGRVKVASHLSDWLEERRMYHRKDGKIVKIKDDLMSATRMLFMSRRFARAVGLGGTAAPRQPSMLARGVDFDVFNPGDSMDVFAS